MNLQDLLPWESGVHAARKWCDAHPDGGGRPTRLHSGRAGPHRRRCPRRTGPLSGAHFPAVGGRDSAPQHQGAGPHVWTTAGAPADHSGEVHHLQGSGELLPAPVGGQKSIPVHNFIVVIDRAFRLRKVLWEFFHFSPEVWNRRACRKYSIIKSSECRQKHFK